MSDTKEFDEIAHRIRTLTTILQTLKQRSHHTSVHSEAIPKFLYHFVTLLTCDVSDDASATAAKIVAATGGLHARRMEILIVTQNPFAKSSVSQLHINELHKVQKSFEDVVSGTPDATMQQHIIDIWTVLAAYDPTAPGAGRQFTSMAEFMVARSFRKLRMLCNEDTRMFRDRQRLAKIIELWRPESADADFAPRWIPVPRWLLPHSGGRRPQIEEKQEVVGGQPILYWKLSAENIREWARLLFTLLANLNDAIEKASKIRGKGVLTRPQSNEERSAISEVNYWCYRLYLFVKWDQRVLHMLLEETSLGSFLSAHMVWYDASKDDEWDLRPEPSETGSQRVLRYLRALTAWHAALKSLSSKRFITQAVANLLVGFVEVLPSASIVTAKTEFIDMYCDRYPVDQEERRAIDMIQKFYPGKFTGTTHAEATLMGLLAYSKHAQEVNFGGEIQNEELLDRILAQAEDAVAVGKKCCWCCARLSGLLGNHLQVDFKIPGTHGLLYAWSPPTIGIDVAVLRQLEGELWDLLHVAVSQRVGPLLSHQSSGSSTNVPSPSGSEVSTMVWREWSDG